MIGIFISPFLKGQVTIAYQGFEGNASDTWGFTPPTQNPALPQVLVGANNYGAGYAAVGNNSMRIGGGSTTCGTAASPNCINSQSIGGNCNDNQNGNVLQFQPKDISCYKNVKVSVAYRTHVVCSGGPGLDGNDQVFLEVSENGGPFFISSTINGFGDCNWNYTSTSVLCDLPAVPNPFVYSVPLGTNTIAFRVRLKVNRADEVLYLDDIKLTGEQSGGFVYPLTQLCVSNPNLVLPILDQNLITSSIGTETFSITPATGLNININSGFIRPSLSTPIGIDKPGIPATFA